MKSIVVSTCIILAMLASLAHAGEKKVTKKQIPAAVLASFEKAYPHATVNGYARETEHGKTFFEIESAEGKLHRDLLYTKEGKVEEIEESVDVAELPEAVRATVNKEYPKNSIATAEKTIHGETIHYEVHLTSGKAKYEVVVDPNGTLVKKSKMDKKSEEEED